MPTVSMPLILRQTESLGLRKAPASLSDARLRISVSTENLGAVRKRMQQRGAHHSVGDLCVLRPLRKTRSVSSSGDVEGLARWQDLHLTPFGCRSGFLEADSKPTPEILRVRVTQPSKQADCLCFLTSSPALRRGDSYRASRGFCEVSSAGSWAERLNALLLSPQALLPACPAVVR
jgi:hypothetical protein